MATSHYNRLGRIKRHLTSATVVEATDAGLEQMRRRYDEERAKRLRPEGEAQYKPLAELALQDERFRRLTQDPWADKAAPVEPVNDSVLVSVIGAGYGGLCAGARLRQAGIPAKDIRLIDKASDVGGTWYYNR